LKSQNSERLS